MNAEFALLEALEKIERDGPKLTRYGLCTNIDLIYDVNCEDDSVDLFEIIAMKWTDRSGDESYPVPHPGLGPLSGYINEQNKYTGEYGAKRMELLHFAADYQRAAMGVKP